MLAQKTGTKTGTSSNDIMIIYEHETIVKAELEESIVQLVNQVLTFLGLIGVIVDPTTAGLEDSERAMGYTEPWDDSVNK